MLSYKIYVAMASPFIAYKYHHSVQGGRVQGTVQAETARSSVSYISSTLLQEHLCQNWCCPPKFLINTI